MRTRIIPLALGTLLLAIVGAGCGTKAEPQAAGGQHTEAEGADEHAGHDHGEAAAPAAHAETESADEHAGHDHGEAEGSDLDQSVASLFEASCEHDMKTFACDECRYEVGVTKAPADLFTGGLLHAAKPAREPVRAPLALTGEVRFDERRVAHLAPPAEGIVRRVLVAVGDRVRRGDVLVEIDSGDAAQAAADLREARSRLDSVEQAHRRTSSLREQGIASAKEMELAVQELESARIRLEAAQAQASRLGLGKGEAAASGVLRLRASVDGTVLSLHAVGGEPAHSEEVMVTVGDIAVVWVWADLYERDLAKLTLAKQQPESLPAEVVVRAWPDQSFPGTVDFVSPSIDEASRTVKLRVTVPNPDGRLLAGMFATVQVLLPGDEHALVLPREAVLEDEGRSFVFVHHHDDFYVRRPVTAGRAWGDRVEITGGLQGDEIVVAEGAFLLKSDVLRSKMGAGCAD